MEQQTLVIFSESGFNIPIAKREALVIDLVDAERYPHIFSLIVVNKVVRIVNLLRSGVSAVQLYHELGLDEKEEITKAVSCLQTALDHLSLERERFGIVSTERVIKVTRFTEEQSTI